MMMCVFPCFSSFVYADNCCAPGKELTSLWCSSSPFSTVRLRALDNMTPFLDDRDPVISDDKKLLANKHRIELRVILRAWISCNQQVLGCLAVARSVNHDKLSRDLGI